MLCHVGLACLALPKGSVFSGVTALTVAGLADVYVLMCFGPTVTRPALEPGLRGLQQGTSPPALLTSGLGAQAGWTLPLTGVLGVPAPFSLSHSTDVIVTLCREVWQSC